MKIIDFHTHYDCRWFDTVLMDEAQFLPGMDRLGVTIACCSTLMGFHEDCRRHNDLMAAKCWKRPDRLIPFATVDPKLGRPAVEELDRCLSNPLFRGVKLHPVCQSFAPSTVRETMIEILKCAARHGAPVMFHDGTPPYASTFQIAAVARWVPEAAIVLSHGGLSDYVYSAGQLLRDLPNLYACYCAPRSGDLRWLVDAAGPDRVLFGSDFGAGTWKVLAERIDSVMEAGLDPASMEKVLHGTAERLLHLQERPLK